MTNASVLWAVCFLPCSGNVHAWDEFLLKQLELKKTNNADRFQDEFKFCHFFASPANSIFSTCQMWHAEYILPWIYRQLNELQWHFISSCLSASCLFLPFSFFILTVQTDLVDLHGGGCETRYVQSSNSTSCMVANYSIVLMICWLPLNVYLDSHSTATTQKFPFKLRDAALIWNFQTYSYFNIIMQRGGEKNSYI